MWVTYLAVIGAVAAIGMVLLAAVDALRGVTDQPGQEGPR